MRAEAFGGGEILNGGKERGQAPNDFRLFVFGEFGKNREGEGFTGGAFGFGKVARLIAERSEAYLFVQWAWVVNFRADFEFGEVGAEGVAMGRPDDELVVDVMVRGFGMSKLFEGEDEEWGEASVVDGPTIEIGPLATSLAPAIEVGEFDLENGGLDGVDAKIATDQGVEVAWFHAVIPEGPHFGSEGVAVADDHSCIAEGSEVFGGVEGEPAGLADGTGGSEGVAGAEGLSGVFEDGDTQWAREVEDGVHIGALAEEVDGNNGFGLRILGESGGEGGDGKVKGGGIDIDEDGSGAEAGDATGGGEESVWGSDDDITGGDIEGHEKEELGICATGASDGVGDADIIGDGFFKGFSMGAEDEGLGIGDRFDGGEKLSFEWSVLAAEIE